jgi:flagellar biosynthetic protein FliR
MTFLWDIDFIYRAFLVVVRLGTIIFFLPLFEGRGVPAMVRVGFVLLFANIVTMSLSQHSPMPSNNIGLLLAALSELGVGLMMGLTIRVAFQTANLAGEIISIQGGFMRDPAFDPLNQASSDAVGRIFSQLALVIFLTSNMHLMVFGAFVKSFDVAPLGHWIPSAGSLQALISSTAQVFIVAVQISAPFIALNFIINMAMAALGKAAPQINVYVTSFAIVIVGGLLLLVSCMDVISHQIAALLSTCISNMLTILSLK